MKITFNKEGLTGDNLKLVEDLEKRMADLPEQVGKPDILKEVRSALKGFVNEQGDTLVDPALLAELLGDDDSKSIKGLRSTLIKQSEDIIALQERTQKKASENPLAAALEKALPEVEKRMAAKGNDKSEVKFNIRAAAIMALPNTIDETAVPQDLIESMAMDAFVKKRRGVQYIYDIADRNVVSELTEYRTWLEEGNEQGAFALVAEGGLKPLVSTALVRNVSKYKKIAGKYVVTEEFTKFRREAYAIIRQLINDKMIREYNAILSADLTTASAGYTGSAFDDTFAAPNDYDAVGVIASQIMALSFIPDTLVLNPADLWRIRLTKDSEGRYLFPVVTTDGQTSMLGFNIITSTYQALGRFKLLETGLYKIWEEPITVRMGYGITVTTATVSGSTVVTNVESDIDTNRMRVIVETFFNDYLATNHIGSLVDASFAVVKAALTI